MHPANGTDPDDLTTGDDYDTDTLRIFADANAEHLVPPHEPDALDALIEARRQETTVDVFLLPHIAADLGYDSVRSWLEAWDRKRQAVTA